MYIGDIRKAPCLHWILPLGTHTHTHTHHIWLLCAYHTRKTHNQTKTQTNSLKFAEAKENIFLCSWYWWYSLTITVQKSGHGCDFPCSYFYIDQCGDNILNILEHPSIFLNILESSQISTFFRVLCGFRSPPGGSQALQGNLQDRAFHFNSFDACLFLLLLFLCKWILNKFFIIV